MAFHFSYSKYGWQIGTPYGGLPSFNVNGSKEGGFGIRKEKLQYVEWDVTLNCTQHNPFALLDKPKWAPIIRMET